MDTARHLPPWRAAALVALTLLLRADACGDDFSRGACTEDSECDDGVFCNGRERCEPHDPLASFRGCVPTIACESTVMDGVVRQVVCDEAAEECAMPLCRTNGECDDGVFCNGRERCSPRDGDSDFFGCVHDPSPCSASQVCSEDSQRCTSDCATRDRDGDGQAPTSCGGTDCDDSDPNRYPGNTEVCDDEDHDEDCDPSTYGSRDVDGDGYVDSSCANVDGTLVNQGPDCNDSDARVHQGATEVCDGVDEDCDGRVDEDLYLTLYVDADYDGYGAAGSDPVHVCPGVPGHAEVATDCDDDNPLIVPGAFRCNGGQGNTFEQCDDTGAWVAGACPNAAPCVQQPSGIGVCLQ